MSNYVIGVRVPYVDQVDAVAEVKAARVRGITVKTGTSSFVLVDAASPKAVQDLKKTLGDTRFIVKPEIFHGRAARPSSSLG